MDSATRKANLEELKRNNENQAMTGIPLQSSPQKCVNRNQVR